MLLDYINKVVQIWLLATTGISAITTTIIMIEYSFVIVTDLKKKIKRILNYMIFMLMMDFRAVISTDQNLKEW